MSRCDQCGHEFPDDELEECGVHFGTYCFDCHNYIQGVSVRCGDRDIVIGRLA